MKNGAKKQQISRGLIVILSTSTFNLIWSRSRTLACGVVIGFSTLMRRTWRHFNIEIRALPPTYRAAMMIHPSLIGVAIAVLGITGSQGMLFAQATELIPSPPQGVLSSFGQSVAISGDVVAVGAPNDGATYSGSVHVFRRSGTLWSQEANLHVSDGNSVGFDVALDGDVLVAGGPQGSIVQCTPPASCYDGIALVFQFDGSTWNRVATLRPIQDPSYEQFGWSVAIEGNVIAVGAPNERVNNDDNAHGALYIFERDIGNGNWVLSLHSVESSGPYVLEFGKHVTVYNGNVFTGAPGQNGYVAVFGKQGGNWTQIQTITSPGSPLFPSSFGAAISITGGTMIIGDPTGRSGLWPTGVAYVYKLISGAWQYSQLLAPSDDIFTSDFGASVAISATWAIVGVPNTGRDFARLYTGSPGSFTFACDFSSSPGSLGPGFGAAAASANGAAVIGDPGEGRAFVYEVSTVLCCGNDTCDPVETSTTCPTDCPLTGCGDGHCDPAQEETHCSCPFDCGTSFCGDGICCADSGETPCRCPLDCGATFCGDGCCGGSESCETCPADCGACPPVPTVRRSGIAVMTGVLLCMMFIIFRKQRRLTT